jgi:putative membrane protein insertion efficiency factor
MKSILILLVRFYQIIIAPMLRFVNGGHGSCRHDPTCSHYAIEAIRVHGALRGAWLAARRLSRCHPWGTHGNDPVPPRNDTTSST